MPYHHVYILQSETAPDTFYTGFTDLPVDERLAYHNRGKVPHTAKHRPWRIKTFVTFTPQVTCSQPGQDRVGRPRNPTANGELG